MPASILSVAVISHAGCDGPFIPLASGSGYQANYDLVRHDKAAGGANSLFNRLVRGARLRYCGCNTGNDYMWYEVNRRGWAANPSVAHGAAALLAEKQVVAYGKYNSGDVKSRCYVYFSCPPGLNYPVRHVKAKHAYSFGTTKAASTFDDIRIAYATAQERDAYLAWYRSRGITGRAANGVITVSAPRPTWYSRDSQKPALLKALVRAIADDPGATPDVRQPPVQGDDPQTVRRLLPLMDKLAADGRLRRAIDDARRANNGVLDLDDFRIWAVVFMPDHDETAYRADLCDDPNVANVRVQP
ncbi:MAG: hypothetical protein HY815_01660 [Candidatus Riflebacteria bacterium]|nr:hypothetical protein [Candidatus Riflebacteria bacterium]